MNEARSYSFLLIHHAWFMSELREAGHRVLSAGWAHPGYDICFERLISLDELLEKLPADFYPDFIIYNDDSHLVSVLGLEDSNVPLLFYSVDVHHHWRWHRHFAALFDVTFVAQKDFIPEFYLANPQLKESSVIWMPLWASENLEPESEKTIDVSFRGTFDSKLHPKRVQFFETVRKNIEIDAGPGPYQEVYPKSKIVLNHAVGEDLNFRVFEAMMAGALLVTPEVKNGFHELFEEGVHLVVYRENDPAHAVQLIRYYQEHEEERQRIALAGRQRVLEKHTTGARALRLLEIVQGLEQEPKPGRYLAAAMTYLAAASLYGGILQEQGTLTWEEQLLMKQTKSCLMKSAAFGEQLDEDFRASVLLCKCYLASAESREELLIFSRAVRERYPSDVILTLNYLEDLLLLSRTSEAMSIAAEISPVPEELLQGVPSLMGEARWRILHLMREKAEQKLSSSLPA